MDQDDPNANSRDQGADNQRLDSWKEIANYLGRTVRTAHRWEKEEGLPVHRHLHQSQSTVYAFTAEIDRWWADRSSASPADTRRGGFEHPRRLAFAALVALVVLLLAYLATVVLPDDATESGTPIPDSVAVLPFIALNTSESDRLLGFAIAEEILNRLSGARSLTVIARTSAFAFESVPTDPADAARRLNVEYLITGNLERDGDVVRVRTRLVDRDGRQIWSRTVDRLQADLFELQDDISQAVIDEIAPHLGVLPRLELRPNPEAYHFYLLGREHLRLDQRALAVEMFQKSIALQPDFDRALGGLAWALALMSGRVMDRVTFREAAAKAEEALTHNPELAEAHLALGIAAIEQGESGDAIRSLTRAVTIDPAFVDARLWLSTAMMNAGEFLQAREQVEIALAIDPLHPLLNTRLAQFFWAAGDYAAARARLVRVLDLPTPPVAPYLALVNLNREYGYLGEALTWAWETALRYPRFAGLNAVMQTYARLGMIEQAEYWYGVLQDAEAGRIPRLGVHSEYLYIRGDIDAVLNIKTEYLERSGRQLSELPLAVQETFGGMQIVAGNYDQGIASLEPWFGPNFELPAHLGGSDFALTFAQLLVFGYLQSGRDADAAALLDRIEYHLERLEEAGLGNRPNLHVVRARCYVLRDQRDDAVRALSTAIDKGWRDVPFERQNPIWHRLRDEARLRALMSQVDSDIARQRQEITSRDVGPGYRDRMQALLGVAQPSND